MSQSHSSSYCFGGEGNLLSEKKDEIRSMESLRSFKVADAVALTTLLVDNLSLFVFKQLSAVSFC
jgi:hypothetical protein